MSGSIKKDPLAKIAVLLLLLLTGWWLFNLYTQQEAQRFFGDFASIYGVMALYGAAVGYIAAKEWGGAKSAVGKAVLFFSLGLLFQEFGQLAYAYLSFFLNISVPYPSIGDIGYFGSIPLYILGIFYLAKASGVKIKLQSFSHQLQAIFIPLFVLGIGYYLFLKGYEFDFTAPLKIFLDFGYPLGQAIYISLAILTYTLTRGVLGGIMKNRVLFILIALSMQFLSDYTFLYQSSRGTWSVGGINDYMYLISYFLMTVGLLQLKTAIQELKNS